MKIKQRRRLWFLQISIGGMIEARWYSRRKWELWFRRRCDSRCHISLVNPILSCDGTEKDMRPDASSGPTQAHTHAHGTSTPDGYDLFDLDAQANLRAVCDLSWMYCFPCPKSSHKKVSRYPLVRHLFSSFEPRAPSPFRPLV